MSVERNPPEAFRTPGDRPDRALGTAAGGSVKAHRRRERRSLDFLTPLLGAIIHSGVRLRARIPRDQVTLCRAVVTEQCGGDGKDRG